MASMLGIDLHSSKRKSGAGGSALAILLTVLPSFDIYLWLWVRIALVVVCVTMIVWSLAPPKIGRLNVTPAIVLILVCGTGLLLGVFWNFLPTKLQEPDGSTNQPVPTSLFDSQLKELQEIDEFISKKDENELRETFDLPNILKFNIEFQKRGLAPKLVLKKESDDIDTFFKNGQGRLDTRYANLTSINNTAHVDWIPGKIGVINTSEKYSKNRALLNKFISSSQVPSTVAVALKNLDAAIEKDSVLLIEILNEQLSKDPRNIVYAETYGSPYYGGTQGLYWSRFEKLRPKADDVSNAIRDYLKIK